MQKRFTAGVSLGLALMLLACAAVAARQATVSIAGPDTAALDATDEILRDVSRLRGLDVKRPVKRGFKTKDEIEQFVIRDLDESTTPAEYEASSKTLTKLGLIDKNFRLRDYVVKLLREQVAGFYQPKTQEFYLASWIPASEQKTVIAHEAVHALQDQHFNLRRFEKWPKGDSDAELAAHALVEGEATVVMLQYDYSQRGGQPMDIVTRIGSLTEMMLDQNGADDAAKFPVLSSAPAVLRENLQFPYIYGAGFVQEVLKSRSWPGLNSSYSDLPASTEQIMHPERFLYRDNPVKIELADLLAALGREWKQIDQDVNGEFGYQVLLGEFVGKWSGRVAAEGWDGDRYKLYEQAGTGALLLAQYTTWDSTPDAQEFFDAYSTRIERRYKASAPGDLNARPRVYETAEGIVAIELRDKDVVIIEGAQTREQMARLLDQTWKSKKK